MTILSTAYLENLSQYRHTYNVDDTPAPPLAPAPEPVGDKSETPGSVWDTTATEPAPVKSETTEAKKEPPLSRIPHQSGISTPIPSRPPSPSRTRRRTPSPKCSQVVTPA